MPADTVQSAVATREEEREKAQRSLARFVDSMRPQLARVLVKAEVADRLARIATTAARTNPKLTECTPLSLAGALLTSATLGPNTPAAECYLVPYRNKGVMEAQLIVGYQGYVKLYRQHPQAGTLRAVAVYPEDEFDWGLGTEPYIHHRPKPHADGSEPTHYYAVARLRGATESEFVVLTADEVKTLRQGKVGPSGDIADPQRWMERKTAIRQLVKTLPKSTSLALAAQVDESGGTDLYHRVQSERVPAGEDPTAELPAGVPVEDPPAGGEGL
jgi:recombination protein RecT